MEKLNKALPESDHHLYKLIVQCLHNNPTHRPASADLLASGNSERQEEFEESIYEETEVHATDEERISFLLKQMQLAFNRRQAETTEHDVC